MNVQELIDEIALKFPDNSAGEITEAVMRAFLTELANRSEFKSESLNIESTTGQVNLKAFTEALIYGLAVYISNSDDTNYIDFGASGGDIEINSVEGNINILSALIMALKGSQVTISNINGNSYLRVHEVGNYAKMESGDGEDLELSVNCDSNTGELNIKATDGVNESLIKLLPDGNINLNSLLFTLLIGGQLSLTTGDSATIEAGAELMLKSLLANLKIQSPNGIITVGSEFAPFNPFQHIEIDSNGVSGSVAVRSSDGTKTSQMNLSNGRIIFNAEDNVFVITGSTGIGLPIYANDAAADSDTNLPQGALYKLTGNRATFQKP
jgi:hypothetical protein